MTTRHDKRVTHTDDLIVALVDSVDKIRKARAAIVDVVRRDSTSARIDGYPTTHSAGGGQGGNQELTAVERAAARLVESGQPADIHHALATRIEVNLRQALQALSAVLNAERLVTKPGQKPETQKCEHCGREDGDRYTDVNGSLPIARYLGSWCIQFVEVRQSSPSYGGAGARLPNDQEIARWFDQGKKPKERVA